MNGLLAYLAALVIGLWGVAHVLPTGRVIAGFGPLTADNRRVLLQEWLAEVITLWGIAILVVLVTVVESDAQVTRWVYRVAAVMLAAIAVLTALTGARTVVIWFKVCPMVLSCAALLLVAASIA